jgi:hypothetical protein
VPADGDVCASTFAGPEKVSTAQPEVSGRYSGIRCLPFIGPVDSTLALVESRMEDLAIWRSQRHALAIA